MNALTKEMTCSLYRAAPPKHTRCALLFTVACGAQLRTGVDAHVLEREFEVRHVGLYAPPQHLRKQGSPEGRTQGRHPVRDCCTMQPLHRHWADMLACLAGTVLCAVRLPGCAAIVGTVAQRRSCIHLA